MNLRAQPGGNSQQHIACRLEIGYDRRKAQSRSKHELRDYDRNRLVILDGPIGMAFPLESPH